MELTGALIVRLLEQANRPGRPTQADRDDWAASRRATAEVFDGVIAELACDCGGGPDLERLAPTLLEGVAGDGALGGFVRSGLPAEVALAVTAMVGEVAKQVLSFIDGGVDAQLQEAGSVAASWGVRDARCAWLLASIADWRARAVDGQGVPILADLVDALALLQALHRHVCAKVALVLLAASAVAHDDVDEESEALGLVALAGVEREVRPPPTVDPAKTPLRRHAPPARRWASAAHRPHLHVHMTVDAAARAAAGGEHFALRLVSGRLPTAA